MHEKIVDLSNSLKDFDLKTCTKRFVLPDVRMLEANLFNFCFVFRQCCIKMSKLLLRLFHLINEQNNFPNDNTCSNLDNYSNLIEKSIQLADTVPEHEIIDEVRMLKAKYVYNVLKLDRKRNEISD